MHILEGALKAAGAATSVILLLLGAFVAWMVIRLLMIRAALRSGLKSVGDRAIAKQPDAITLAQDGAYAWKDEAGMKRLADPLAARGFAPAGDYSVPELPGLHVRFLLNAPENVYACVYEHSRVGVWLDLVSRYEDGTGATFASTPDRGMEHRPENTLVHAPGLPSEALLERILKERPRKPLVNLTVEKLKSLFELAYREQIAWRKRRGATAEEVAKVIATRQDGKGS